MATDPTKVLVSVTGAFYVDQTGAAALPTSTATALAAAYKDQGFVSEDGLTLALPDAGEKTTIKGWQNGAIVRTFRAASEDNPTLQLTLIETKLDTIQTAFGATVTQSATEGTFDFDSNKIRTPVRGVLDVIDGAQLIRLAVPRGIVTAVGEIAFTNTDAIGYNVTIDLDRDPTLGFNFRSFMTALKS